MSSSPSSSGGSSNVLPAPSQTRLLTIVAHVDHGKTTLADSLVESNGIISERHAGTIRYLDSLEDEQRRGITMRASAIGLRHRWRVPKVGAKVGAKNKGGGGGDKSAKDNNPSAELDMVIHLIDSPGHVDFSSEVTTSLLSCDGALLVVDAVEGMCPRTHSILREAYAAQLVPVLVINKVDRLCSDLGLGINEAYVRLRELVESLNAACAGVIVSARAERLASSGSGGGGGGDGRAAGMADEKKDASSKWGEDGNDDEFEEEETVWSFDPIRGNVVFCSALHGWGFTVPALARSLFKSKAVPNIKPPVLRQYLFGDFRYRHEDGKVVRWKQADAGGDDSIMTMFAEFALRPLWDAYDGAEEAAAVVEGAQRDQKMNGGGGGGGAAKESKSDRITSSTPGMDRVLKAVQVGSTAPPPSATSSSGGEPDLHATPKTPQHLQQILYRTGAGTSKENVLRAVLRRYRPLSDAVLDSACEHCPDPRAAQGGSRIDVLGVQDLPPEAAAAARERAQTTPAPTPGANEQEGGEGIESSSAEGQRREEHGGGSAAAAAATGREMAVEELRWVQDGVRRCDAGLGVPTVAYVCKFMATDRSYVTDPDLPSDLNGNGGKMATGVEGGDIRSSGDDDGAHKDSSKPRSMIMGLARVLSGTLHSGGSVEYYAFGPKYSPEYGPAPPGDKAVVPVPRRKLRLYLLMGSSFVAVNSVPAGHICAVYDLEDLQLKTVTLCDSRGAMPVRGFHHGLKPLVKVNVEPVSAMDTAALERGLVKLSLADASVEVTATAKGERILACLGEIHLEQSIRDLERVYCAGSNVRLRVSEPIVEFGECTAWFENELTSEFEQFYDDGRTTAPPLRQVTIPPYCYEEGLVHARRGRCRALLSGRPAAISVRVVPLPGKVYDSLKLGAVIDGSEEDMCNVGKVLRCHEDGGSISAHSVLDAILGAGCHLDSNGNAMIETEGVRNGLCIKSVLSDDGEIYVPPTLLPRVSSDLQSKGNVDNTDEELSGGSCGEDTYEAIQNLIRLGGIGGHGAPPQSASEECPDAGSAADCCAAEIWRSEMRGSAVAGFQLAMRSGPFCEEPVRGVMVVIEAVEIALKPKPSDASASQSSQTRPKSLRPVKPVSGGMVVAALRTGIRCALLTRPSRLVEGHLRLTLHSSLAGLGPLYAVLSKRRGKVLSDTMVDGTDLIRITATLPQAESFHLAPELLKESSGEVTAPELVFSHWEVLEEDPFWIPTSLEEREDYGEILMSGDSSTGLRNNAIKYIRMVRDRKGLLVDSKKIVVAAEKQRTLAKKK